MDHHFKRSKCKTFFEVCKKMKNLIAEKRKSYLSWVRFLSAMTAIQIINRMIAIFAIFHTYCFKMILECRNQLFTVWTLLWRIYFRNINTKKIEPIFFTLSKWQEMGNVLVWFPARISGFGIYEFATYNPPLVILSTEVIRGWANKLSVNIISWNWKAIFSTELGYSSGLIKKNNIAEKE